MLASVESSSPPLPLLAMLPSVSVSWPRPGYGNKAFTGREWDPEVQLHYYRARHYDPQVGRFLSLDPVGFVAGLNLYTYVSSDPVNWVDPLGLAKKRTGSKRKTYTSADSAAVEGLKAVNKESIKEDYEVCFSVCEQGGSYFNSPPFTNYFDSGSCPRQPCPPGSKRAAVCHTHGAPESGYPGFSGSDIPDKEVNFVADGAGDITKYDPSLPGDISHQQKYMCRGCAK